MGHITKQCPQCGNQISWLQKWQYTTLYATRRVRPCPNCGVKLRWSRIPWYIINGGVIGLLAILFFRIRGDITTGTVFLLLYLADMIIMAIAASFLEFQAVESDDDRKAGATMQAQTPQCRDSEK